MTSPPVESQAWPRRRWLVLIVLVFAGQVGLVFWLATRKVTPPHSPEAGPVVFLPADQSADLPGVTDPTLFVLPNSHGFSGPAWLQFPPSTYSLEPWTEPSRPLQLELPQLGSTLSEFVRNNQPRPFELVLTPPTQLDSFAYLPLPEPPSTFSLEGEIANRPLLSLFKLDAWTATEILTNSEVQIAVDAAGRVFSSVLLAKCGFPEADTNALKLARSARFQPLRWIDNRPPPAAPDGLSFGKIVFHWRTIEVPNPVPPNK